MSIEVWYQTEPAFPGDVAVGRWFSLTDDLTVMHNGGNGYATADEARQAAGDTDEGVGRPKGRAPIEFGCESSSHAAKTVEHTSKPAPSSVSHSGRGREA